MKKFNTAGPSIKGDHYMIDPLTRFDLPEIESLIDDKRYFVLHAPRQTGKTTSLLALMHHLNAKGQYRALYANIEAAQAVRGDVSAGVAIIGSVIAHAASLYLNDHRLIDWLAQEGERTPWATLCRVCWHTGRKPLTSLSFCFVNGGGRINREYGLGRRSTDLFLEWPVDEALGFLGTVQRVVIELKIFDLYD